MNILEFWVSLASVTHLLIITHSQNDKDGIPLREKVHWCYPRWEGLSLIPPGFHASPNSCFQRTRHLLQGRQCGGVWTQKEWGGSRETEDRVSSVRLNTLTDMEREKKLTQTIFVATCY